MTDLRQAAQALLNRWDSPLWNNGSTANAIADLRAALEQQAEPCQYCGLSECDPKCMWIEQAPQQQAEPVSQAVIAGALFDFMGWLTTRKERLVLSSTDNASPAADAIKDFAEMRGLLLDDAKVQDWQAYTAPPQRKPLTEAQQVDCLVKSGCIGTVKMSFESGPYDITRPSINASMLIEAVEAAHGIKEGT